MTRLRLHGVTCLDTAALGHASAKVKVVMDEGVTCIVTQVGITAGEQSACPCGRSPPLASSVPPS